MNGADIITIIRDPKHTLGKRFSIKGDGSLNKESNVMVAFGVAEQRHVPDAGAMADLLREVAEDPHAAIINAYFPAILVGERFVVLSEKEMGKRLKLKTREQRVGVHSIGYEGSILKAVCRLKDNVRPSSWQLFDRDVDRQTPAQFGAAMDFDAWLAALGNLLPGVDSAPMVRAGSSSARVLMNGEPVGAGNGHLWVQIADADDAERLKVALQVRAAELDMAWRKLNKHGKAGALTTIIDTSVLIPGRLVFCGKPTATGKLEVLDQTVEVMGGDTRADTSAVLLPPDDVVREVTRRAGVEMTVRRGKGNSLAVDAYDLSYGTQIDLEGGNVLTVRDALDCLDDGKLRCQTPFRESESVAGVLRRGGDGRPCLFDVGDGTTHWLNNDEWVAEGFDDENDKVLAKINAQIDAYELAGELAGEAQGELLVAVRTLITDIPAEARAQAQVDALIERLTAAGCDPAATEQALQPAVQREAVAEKADRGRVQFLSAREVLRKVGPVDWLVENLFEADAIGMLIGESQSYKSFLAFDVGLSVAAGIDWHGEKVQEGPVIYIAGEGHNGIARRMAAWGRHRGIDVGALPFFVSSHAIPLLDVKAAEEVARSVKDIAKVHGNPKLVVIDTLGRNFGDGDEGVSKDFYKFIDHIDVIRRLFKATVVVVHHTGHGDKTRGRGSSSMRQGVDFEYIVEKTEHLTSKMWCQKMKDAALPGDRYFRGQAVTLDMEGVDSLAFDLVGDYKPPKEKTKQMGKAQRPMMDILRRLADESLEGWVSLTHWKQTAAGDKVLPEANRDQRFSTLWKGLKKRELIEVEGDNVRPAGGFNGS